MGTILKTFLICLLLCLKTGVKSKNGIKFTNIYCQSLNETWVRVNECRLRAIKRDLTVMNMNITFRQLVPFINWTATYKKKANGYKPFVMDFSIDACDYLKKKNNAIANMIYSLFKNFSNMNHTCPFIGDQILKNYYPRTELRRVLLPAGDYALLMSWYFSKAKTLITNIYFSVL